MFLSFTPAGFQKVKSAPPRSAIVGKENVFSITNRHPLKAVEPIDDVVKKGLRETRKTNWLRSPFFAKAIPDFKTLTGLVPLIPYFDRRLFSIAHPSICFGAIYPKE